MAGRPSLSSSYRARRSSPFGHRKPPSTSYSSSSSSSCSSFNGGGRLIPRSSPSSVSSHFHSSGMPRSSTLNRGRSDPSRNRALVSFPTAEELIVEPAEVSSRACELVGRPRRGKTAEVGKFVGGAQFDLMFDNSGKGLDIIKIGHYIASNGGVVTAEQLAPYLDVMPTKGKMERI